MAVEAVVATEMAAAAIADRVAMPDVTAVPFAGFLAFDEPLLGGGTAVAAEQVTAAKSGILASEAPAAALANGTAMPDAAAIPSAGALALDAPFLEEGAAAAAE